MLDICSFSYLIKFQRGSNYLYLFYKEKGKANRSKLTCWGLLSSMGDMQGGENTKG